MRYDGTQPALRASVMLGFDFPAVGRLEEKSKRQSVLWLLPQSMRLEFVPVATNSCTRRYLEANDSDGLGI